jgi:putative copper export protein/methionine-rich copper-binding protein CopC
MMRRILFLTLSLCLAAVTRASAHQQLLAAAPGEGATLDAAPAEIRLTFNQGVDLALASLRLIGPGGEVALASLEVPADAPKVLRARIEGRLVAGRYTVRWLVTGDDGHPVRGAYDFEIQPGAAGLPLDTSAAGTSAVQVTEPGPSVEEREPTPPEHHAGTTDSGFSPGSPLYAAVRWLTFSGIVAAIGAVAFALLLLPSLVRRGAALPVEAVTAARTNAATVGLAAAAVLAVALVLRLLAQSAALQGAEESGPLLGAMLTRTFWGWGWMLQGVATVALVVGLTLARGRKRVGWGVAAAAALALGFTPALSGHAVATSAVAVVSDGLHVLAAGGWLGTLLLMLLVGVPLVAGSGTVAGAGLARLLGAFTPLALTFAAVLTITGVLAASLHLPDVPSLWTTAYGRTLLVKVAALLFVFGAGAYNWLRVKPALERGAGAAPLRRSAAAELAMGALVLAVTAALVATPPPAEQEPVAIQPSPPGTVLGDGGKAP